MSDREEFEKWILEEWGEPFHDFHGFKSGNQWSYSDHNLNAVWLGYSKGQAARESEGGEAAGLRHALQRVDPLSFNNFDELLGEMQRNGITCAQKPDKWIPCSERLPTEADEDFHSCVWVCFIDGEIELHEAQEVIDTWDDDFAITHWMPTGLTRPAPPEQESE